MLATNILLPHCNWRRKQF